MSDSISANPPDDTAPGPNGFLVAIIVAILLMVVAALLYTVVIDIGPNIDPFDYWVGGSAIVLVVVAVWLVDYRGHHRPSRTSVKR